MTRLRRCLLWLPVIMIDAGAAHAAVADGSLPPPAPELSPDAGVTDDAAAPADGAAAQTAGDPGDSGPASPDDASRSAVASPSGGPRGAPAASPPPAPSEASTSSGESPNDSPTDLSPIVVVGRSENLVGVADTATQGAVSSVDISRRPILRPGEVLETIPGVVITQHAGGGKANQYFLRGFNLDHGSDFATFVDGIPINLSTHAHGQGYTDLNWIVPELVQGVDHRKGPYFADIGDFGAAGAANIKYCDRLEHPLVKLEGGPYGFARIVAARSSSIHNGTLLFGAEGYHDDGPWQQPANYRRVSGVIKYSRGNEARGWSVSFFGYGGMWTSTDQIPVRAITGDNAVPGGFKIDRYGTLDPSSGGRTDRLSLSAEWHRRSDQAVTTLLVYAYQYGLDLYSNFTGYLSPEGDEIFERDRRIVTGTKLSHGWFTSWQDHYAESRVGLDVRADFVTPELFTSRQRVTLSIVRADDVRTVGVSPWAESRVTWTSWLRTLVGLRGDFYAFDVRNGVGGISSSTSDAIASPKGSVVLGPWLDLEFYLSGGFGFHTSDARGTAVTVDRAQVFARQRGGEAGLRYGHIKGLQSTLSAWFLDSDNETVFIGDSGTTEPSGRKGRRDGVELTAYYDARSWLTIDGEVAVSRARFKDHDSVVGDYIPDSAGRIAAAGISLHDLRGFFTSVRVRYFGPRALIEDNSVRSSGSTIFNARVGYQISPIWTVSVDVLNLLNAKVNEQEYYYSSRLPNESENPANSIASGGDGGYFDRHVHPAEPITVRVGLVARF